VIPRRAPFLLLALLACRRTTPEEQVRRTLAKAETAVEEKDLRTLARLVSARYADKEQNDRNAVLGLLRLQVVTRPALHVLLRVGEIGFPAPGSARVSLVAALASLPLASTADLARARADLYRFELTLAEEARGEWKVVSAAWGPARLEDFL
jgi:hypothetical protein